MGSRERPLIGMVAMVASSQTLGAAMFAIETEWLRGLLWLLLQTAIIGVVVTVCGLSTIGASLISFVAAPLCGYFVSEARRVSGAPVASVRGPDDVSDRGKAELFAFAGAELLKGREGAYTTTSKSKSGGSTTTRHTVAPLVTPPYRPGQPVTAWALDPGSSPRLAGAVLVRGETAERARTAAVQAARQHHLPTAAPPVIVELCEAPHDYPSRRWRYAQIAIALPLLASAALGAYVERRNRRERRPEPDDEGPRTPR